MKRLLIITTIMLAAIMPIKAQEETTPYGVIVDCYKKDHPTKVVEKMEETNVYSISWGLVFNYKRAVDAWNYAEANEYETWKAEWDTIEMYKNRMYQQIKDPFNFHHGIQKEGYKLYVIDYYDRQRDTVFMLYTGDENLPYREASSYLSEWKQVSADIDKVWSEQYKFLNNNYGR